MKDGTVISLGDNLFAEYVNSSGRKKLRLTKGDPATGTVYCGVMLTELQWKLLQGVLRAAEE